MRQTTSQHDALPERSGAYSNASLSSKLTLTRIAWLIITVLCLVLFITSLPLRLSELTQLVAATNPPHLGAINFAPVVYVVSAFALELFGSLIFLTLALLIVWRRSDNLAAIRISALLIAFGVALPGTAYAIVSGAPIWQINPSALQALGWSALLIFAYLFPDGQWIPRWTRFLVPLWLLWTASFFAFAGRLTAGRPALIAISYLIWIAWLGTGVGMQVYRYHWVATPMQRQQSKWVLLGFTGALVGILLVSAQNIIALVQGKHATLSAHTVTLSLIALTLSALPIPISIAIAILKHNLFSIDRFINLSLVYGALTLVIGSIYAGSVGLSQFIIQSITGRGGQSQLALTLSTFAVAAIFQPLRRRIQRTIDRQFYRRRYDATQTIAAFSASLRAEVDLSEITKSLIRVAHHTMQPSHVSLWLTQLPAHTPDNQAAHLAETPQLRADTTLEAELKRRNLKMERP